MTDPIARHPALAEAWRDVATAGENDDKREAYQAALLEVFRPGGLVAEGELDKAEATDDLIALGEAHHGLFRGREDLEHLIHQASLGLRALTPRLINGAHGEKITYKTAASQRPASSAKCQP